MSQRPGRLSVTPFTLPSPAWRVMLYGVLLTLLLFGAVRHLELDETDQAFQGDVSRHIANLRIGLHEVTDQLRHARDVLMDAEPFQENVFAFVANHILTERHFAQHVTFRRIVSHEDRQAYEARMQKQYPGFRITELENEQHVPAKERLNYHVLEHIAPAETGIFIRGLDAVSLNAEDDAISRAMSTGLPAATALYPPEEITLPIHQDSITLILPVYDRPLSVDGATFHYPEQIGEVALTLNAVGLFRELLAQFPLLHQPDIGIEVIPGSDHEQFPALLRLGSLPTPSDQQPAIFRNLLYNQPPASTHTLWLGGQPWHIVVSRQPHFFIHHHSLSVSILFGGLLLSGIAALWVRRSTAYTEYAEDLIAKRTAELERNNRRLRKHIERRKALKRDLQESRQRFQHLTHISSDWYWETDTEHRFTIGMDKEGMRSKPMLGKRMWDFPSIDLTAEEWEAHRRTLAARQPVKEFEYRVYFPDGSERWFCTNAEPFWDRSGRFCGYRGTSRDITAYKKATLALEKSEKSIRRLLVYKEQAREEERKRIAREIHDDLGQYLLVMRYDLAALLDGSPAPDEHLLQLADKLDAATRSLRRIINNLRPPILDQGLLAALQWQCGQFQKQHSLCCHLSWETDLEVVEEAVSIALFRIVQESLSNVARHAQASEVHIRIWTDQDSLHLQVRDNGKGVSEHNPGKPESFGVLGMTERAKTLGGHLCFTSAPGQGATLLVSLPLRPNTPPEFAEQEPAENEPWSEQSRHFISEPQNLSPVPRWAQPTGKDLRL